MTIGGLLHTVAAKVPEDKAKKIAGAAEQFESLMISQLLESLTQAEGDSSASTLDMGKQQMAQAIAAGGGLGLKKMIVESMKRQTGPVGQATL